MIPNTISCKEGKTIEENPEPSLKISLKLSAKIVKGK